MIHHIFPFEGGACHCTHLGSLRRDSFLWGGVPPPSINWGSNPGVYKSLKKDDKEEEEEEKEEEEEEEEENGKNRTKLEDKWLPIGGR